MSLPTTQRVAFLLGPERVEIRQVPLPEVGRGEILLRIRVATTCGTDLKVFRRGGHPRMLRPPSPFGHEMAGRVAAVGAGVDSVACDDSVVVANSACCGSCPPCRSARENLCEDLAYLNGAFGEYLLVPERFVERSTYRLPRGLETERASLAEPLACVFHGIDRTRLEPESSVLIVGGGPIGLMFVQVLARQRHRVTLVDRHSSRLELSRELGAAVAHRLGEKERLVDEIVGAQGERPFDATIDATGSPAAWEAITRLTRAGGRVNFFGGCAPGTEVRLDTGRVHYGELTLLGSYHHRPATFERALRHLAADGAALERLITARRPLAEIEAALRDMWERRALKVAIVPDGT